MTQLTLLQPATERAKLKPLSGHALHSENPRQEAERERRERPEIYRAYERLALDYASRGEHFGINLLREQVRWHTWNFYKGKSPYKVRNSLAPYYSRMLIAAHPELKKFMVCHETKY